MTEATAIAQIATYLLQIGEWFFALVLFGIALWRQDPILYLITAIGLGYQGVTWYSDYPIIGVMVMLVAVFCVYKTIRYYVG